MSPGGTGPAPSLPSTRLGSLSWVPPDSMSHGDPGVSGGGGVERQKMDGNLKHCLSDEAAHCNSLGSFKNYCYLGRTLENLI